LSELFLGLICPYLLVTPGNPGQERDWRCWQFDWAGHWWHAKWFFTRSSGF